MGKRIPVGYRSPFEGVTSDFLRSREKKYGYRTKFEADKIPFKIERVYKPDFTITFPSGKKRFIECKGYFDPPSVTKMLHVKRCNPELDIRFVFMKDNLFHKGQKQTYSMWAERHGYPFAFKTIPLEWLTEEG